MRFELSLAVIILEDNVKKALVARGTKRDGCRDGGRELLCSKVGSARRAAYMLQ